MPTRAVAAALAATAALAQGASFGPVIGVLTQPLGATNVTIPGSYLEAWYVRWLEAQGARVVPLRFDAPDKVVDALLARVNGVLFPGGHAPIAEGEPYGRFGARIFRAAVGRRMPLWGTCLGFEQAMLYSSGEAFPGPLTPGWQSEPIFAPLNLTRPQPQGATILAGWPQRLLEEAGRSPWTWHAHINSVSTGDFARRSALRGFWHVLATNVDLRGAPFVSLAQAQGGLPLFASQFHPEKNAHEWESPADAPLNGTLPVHSPGAVEVSNRLAAFFVDRARGFRGFGFSAEEFWASCISLWPLRLAGQTKGLEWASAHMEVYAFPPWSASEAASAELIV